MNATKLLVCIFLCSLVSGAAAQRVLKTEDLADLHRSAEFSRFTNAIVRLASIYDYTNMGLEMGPVSANYLTSMTNQKHRIPTATRSVNRTYGVKSQGKGPLVFVDKVEDQWFLQALKDNDYRIWGLDHEYALTNEMHLDTLYSLLDQPTKELEQLYLTLKHVMREGSHKSFSSGKSQFNCNIKRNNGLQSFFRYFEGNDRAQFIISSLKESWDIYCINERGNNNNKIRANGMKSNFDELWEHVGSESKLLLKMGNEHLTHGTSSLGVDDLGKYVSDSIISKTNDFLIIRHVRRFHDGKDLLGKTGYESASFFMPMGKKEFWSLIDLRPIRKLLQEGSITASKKVAYELNNYDLIVIPPNDTESGELF